MNSIKKKVLIVTTVSGFLTQFETENVRSLLEMGYEVHYACNYNMAVYKMDEKFLNQSDIKRHQIDFSRSPYSVKNIKAYKQLKEVFLENKFDLVHCHTPMGSVITRLVAKKIGYQKVIYTVHGFHFYKGAPIRNWLLYYPVEKQLARYTNTIVTIAKEDYERVKKFAGSKDIVYINGVGIDVKQIQDTKVDYNEYRDTLNIPANATILMSVGELNRNKNHQVVIKALAKLKDNNIYYIICGEGGEREKLLKMAKRYKIEERVRLLGYRTDINELMKVSDIYVLPSIREGKSVSLMKAMAAGMPVIASKIRGNNELVVSGKGGYLVDKNRVELYEQSIRKLMINPKVWSDLGSYNKTMVEGCTSLHIKEQMKQVYSKVILDSEIK